MITKTITYTDYNGDQRTEEFRFNLTKAELFEKAVSVEGGIDQLLRKIIAEKDLKKMVDYFKELLLQSYGVKSPDGKRFEKSEELTKAFKETEAYSDLFIELATDAQKATDFVNGIIPKDLDKSFLKEQGNMTTLPILPKE